MKILNRYLVLRALLFLQVVLLALFHQKAMSQNNGCSVSEVLAEMTVNTRSEEISEEAYLKAKMSIIDILGISMAGYDAPGIPTIREQFQDWGGKQESSVWFSDIKLPALSAGFVNSSMAHALDLDDWHKPSNTHISVISVPTAFAVGELTSASGQEVLDAIVIGVEVANSIGVQYVKYREHLRFLPTSIVGGFGATAIACRLMGLSVDQTINAFGIFYSHASGNRQALFDHTLTKRIQPAIAVKAAILAAFLAKKGFTGPENIFLSEAGLLKIYAGNTGSVPQVSDFIKADTSWAVERLAFKKYASCGASHPAIESAIRMSKKYNLKLDEIESIELFGIFVGSGMVDIPWYESDNPHVLAQFCAPYEVVSAIKNQNFGPAEITNERIKKDRDVSELAPKVIIKHEREWGEGYPGGQTVKVKRKNGEVFVESYTPSEMFDPGSFTMNDIIDKFISNALFSGRYSKKASMQMAKKVISFNEIKDIKDFIKDELNSGDLNIN